MSNKKSSEELQSRREFFKKAAKAALPVVGAVVLSSLPIEQTLAATGCDGMCSNACISNCEGGCSGECKFSCMGDCKGLCNQSCYSGCRNTCHGTCSGGCAKQAYA